MLSDMIVEEKLTAAPNIPELAFIDDRVGTLSRQAGEYVKAHLKTLQLLAALDAVVTLGIGAVLAFVPALHATFGGYYVALLAPSIAFFVPFLVTAQKKAEEIFAKNFATLGNYSYAPSAPLESVSGDLFSLGNVRSLANVLSGTYKKHPFRLFTYLFRIQRGKSSVNYRATVLEVKLPKAFINCRLLSSVETVFISFPTGGRTAVSLEGDFNKHFSLFTQPETDVEIRELFTPDLMQALVANYVRGNFEVNGDKLYVYSVFEATDKDKFLYLYSLMDLVLTRLDRLFKEEGLAK